MNTLEAIEVSLHNVPIIEDTSRSMNYEIPTGSQPPDHYLAKVSFDILDTRFKVEHIRKWCKQHCNSFYQVSNWHISNIPPHGIKVVFFIRFADKNDLLKFKMSWG